MSLPFTVLTIGIAKRFLTDKEIPAKALNFTRWIIILVALYLQILSSFYDRYSGNILLGIIIGILMLICSSFFSKRRTSDMILDEEIE